jgi:hypothetical protein
MLIEPRGEDKIKVTPVASIQPRQILGDQLPCARASAMDRRGWAKLGLHEGMRVPIGSADVDRRKERRITRWTEKGVHQYAVTGYGRSGSMQAQDTIVEINPLDGQPTRFGNCRP